MPQQRVVDAVLSSNYHVTGWVSARHVWCKEEDTRRCHHPLWSSAQSEVINDQCPFASEGYLQWAGHKWAMPFLCPSRHWTYMYKGPLFIQIMNSLNFSLFDQIFKLSICLCAHSHKVRLDQGYIGLVPTERSTDMVDMWSYNNTAGCIIIKKSSSEFDWKKLCFNHDNGSNIKQYSESVT